jgi:hypothetical protein
LNFFDKKTKKKKIKLKKKTYDKQKNIRVVYIFFMGDEIKNKKCTFLAIFGYFWLFGVHFLTIFDPFPLKVKKSYVQNDTFARKMSKKWTSFDGKNSSIHTHSCVCRKNSIRKKRKG